MFYFEPVEIHNPEGTIKKNQKPDALKIKFRLPNINRFPSTLPPPYLHLSSASGSVKNNKIIISNQYKTN